MAGETVYTLSEEAAGNRHPRPSSTAQRSALKLCQFPFRWIYYYGSNKSTGTENGKTHLCAVGCWLRAHKTLYFCKVIKKIERILQESTWNIRHMVNETIVRSTQRPIILKIVGNLKIFTFWEKLLFLHDSNPKSRPQNEKKNMWGVWLHCAIWVRDWGVMKWYNFDDASLMPHKKRIVIHLYN